MKKLVVLALGLYVCLPLSASEYSGKRSWDDSDDNYGDEQTPVVPYSSDNKRPATDYDSQMQIPVYIVQGADREAVYSEDQLKQFVTLHHLLEDLIDAQDPIVLPFNPSLDDFDELIRLANNTLSDKERELDPSMSIDRIMNIFLLAKFLDSADKKTLYPLTLAILNYLALPHVQDIEEKNKIINFFFAAYPEDTAVFLLDNFFDVMNDTTYAFDGLLAINSAKQEIIKNAVRTILATDYLKNTVNNGQAKRCIAGIKARSIQYARGRVLPLKKMYQRINQYLYGTAIVSNAEVTNVFPLVPQQSGQKPSEGQFPLTLADLIQYKFIDLADYKEGYHEKLNLENNRLTFIEPNILTGFDELEEISAYNNNLTMLAAGTFTNLPRLQTITVSGNQIAVIEPGAFNNLPALEDINLSGNNITGFQAGVFLNLPALRRIQVRTNPLKQTEQEIRDQNPGLNAGIELY